MAENAPSDHEIEVAALKQRIVSLDTVNRELREQVVVGQAAQRNLVAQADRLSAARGVIHQCAEQFRTYQAVHEAKGTPDGNIKAQTNESMALVCDGWLGGGS